MDSDLRKQVWERLVNGKSLDGLDLPTTNGRVDLRGWKILDPLVIGEYNTASAKVKGLGNIIVLRDVHLSGIDFSESRLNSLRFHGCEIENCSFNDAECQDWRMWDTRISNTSFRSTDLRRSALGAVDEGKRNSFRSVDFTKADLLQTADESADIIDSIFSDSDLTKVGFQGTVFVNCVFEGRLDEVIFNRYAFRGERYPPNEMKGVDFRRARFRFVEFRRLAMTDVKWPEGDDCILLENYSETLKLVLQNLKTGSDIPSKKMAAILEHDLKWAGPGQKQGVISKRDLNEVAGEWGVAEFLRLVGTGRSN
jgi:uncharacterized protein YjbI with pentapeptide repeats